LSLGLSPAGSLGGTMIGSMFGGGGSSSSAATPTYGSGGSLASFANGPNVNNYTGDAFAPFGAN
ncbi:MAG: hypothetical protein KDC14_13910, partial [Planctomycetes bacterium]|nr:hypothetical protein [Planctomycetota bacterium]